MVKQGAIFLAAMLAIGAVHSSPLTVANEFAVKEKRDRKISAGSKVVVGFSTAAYFRHIYETHEFNRPDRCEIEPVECTFGESFAAGMAVAISDGFTELAGNYAAPVLALYGTYGVYQWFRPNRFERDVAALADENSALLLLGKYSARDQRNRYIKSWFTGSLALYSAINAPEFDSGATLLALSLGGYSVWRALTPTHIERGYAGVEAPTTEVSWQFAPTLDGGAVASVSFAF